MSERQSPPELMLVNVLSDGGPFRAGDILSVAYNDPTVGRLIALQGSDAAASPGSRDIPETITAVAATASAAYAVRDRLTISFIDPAVARLHRVGSSDSLVVHAGVAPHPTPAGAAVAPGPSVASTPSTPPRTTPLKLNQGTLAPSPASVPRPAAEFSLRLHWTSERAQRFLTVVERLFTVDRLGWYRHVLALRLLLPDDATAADEATRERTCELLRSLRTSALDALAAPLMAAYMPNFSVNAEWLDSLDRTETARSLADLAEVLALHLGSGSPAPPAHADVFVSTLTHDEFIRARRSGTESFLAALIPSLTVRDGLTEALSQYRSTLVELFEQVGQSSEAVRLGAMTAINPLLDDRLRAVSDAIKGDVLATAR